MYSALEDHPAEAGDVGGGRKKPAGRIGMSLFVCERVGELSDRDLLQALTDGIGLVRFWQPSQLLIARPESRVFHAEWFEEPFLHELFVADPAGDLDQAPHGVD